MLTLPIPAGRALSGVGPTVPKDVSIFIPRVWNCWVDNLFATPATVGSQVGSWVPAVGSAGGLFQNNSGSRPTLQVTDGGRTSVYFDGSKYLFNGPGTVGTMLYRASWTGTVPFPSGFKGLGSLDDNAAGSPANGGSQLTDTLSLVPNGTVRIGLRTMQTGHTELNRQNVYVFNPATVYTGVTNHMFGLRDNTASYWTGYVTGFAFSPRILSAAEQLAAAMAMDCLANSLP